MFVDDDEILIKYSKVIDRAKTFSNPKHAWKFVDRPAFQSPLVFAEAGFELTAEDGTLFCQLCNKSFALWSDSFVPITEHKKIVSCPFVREWNRSVYAMHPFVEFAVRIGLLSMKSTLDYVESKPVVLNGTLSDFVSDLVKPFKSDGIDLSFSVCRSSA